MMNDQEITQNYVDGLQQVLDTLSMVPANKDLDDAILTAIRTTYEIKSYFVNYLILHYDK